jgi:purine-binding chemotaxis protein CheW
MVDLVKIRNKKKRSAAPAEPALSGVEGSSPPPPVENGGEDAAGPAGETPALRTATSGAGSPQATTNQQPATSNASPSKLEKFKAEAGQRRAFESARTEDATPQNQLELLTFVIAGEQYAVDIERIVEIVTPRAVTRIPNADASVVGIISLRGTIVTLVDVRRKLRHREAGDSTDDTRIVVIDFQHEIVGFIVDRVLRVVKTAAGDIERHPVVHATELDESVRGVFRAAGALTILLDLDKLLDHGSLAARSA